MGALDLFASSHHGRIGETEHEVFRGFLSHQGFDPPLQRPHLGGHGIGQRCPLLLQLFFPLRSSSLQIVEGLLQARVDLLDRASVMVGGVADDVITSIS